MENESKRAKRGIIIAFSVLVCILLVIAVIFFMYRSQHTFSQEKWLSNASERYMIVDMLEKHPLIGISEDNVIALLGAEDGDGQSSFKLSDKNYPPETTLVYYLGVEYMDYMWLIISTDNGTVTEYCIDVT